LQLIHIVSQENVATATRNIIIAEAGAEGVVIESYFGNQDQAYLTSSISEVFVAENAHLTLYKLQNEASKALHFSGIYSQQDRQSTFNYLDFSFGALIARNELHTSLGFASSCDLNGLFVAGGRQHIDNHTWIKHQQAHGSSRELFKGILDGRARGVFQGCVEVFEGAQKIDSEMHNHNLLLSDNAEIDTKPQLIIYADDVKCAHGVTVGQLEDASIFYLQSRSVSEEDARDMLTFAFANEMVDKIKVSSFKKYILALLLQKFPQGSIEQEWL
jgi:Fe-S cluster assembly protein SufD